ncbi:MAG: acyl-CoA thioesterase [Deltaproteobacteria bacterium]|nr:acyl-CoA thioesterase [Candidatus Anaeroferrophillus wilburensis]MBN2888612.1 acyl-CoA thioesterase [Deltaproteobacteria bacterium]
MVEKRKFFLKLPVRFRDLDAMGHVNNATYFTYMEEARKEFFGAVFNSSSPDDFPFVLASISCTFIRPVQLRESMLAASVLVSRLGGRSFTFNYEIYRPDDSAWLFATGESVQVFYDYKQGRSMAMPDQYAVKLKQYLW